MLQEVFEQYQVEQGSDKRAHNLPQYHFHLAVERVVLDMGTREGSSLHVQIGQMTLLYELYIDKQAKQCYQGVFTLKDMSIHLLAESCQFPIFLNNDLRDSCFISLTLVKSPSLYSQLVMDSERPALESDYDL